MIVTEEVDAQMRVRDGIHCPGFERESSLNVLIMGALIMKFRGTFLGGSCMMVYAATDS